ncbi:MAG: acetyl-CoA C-acyltransferase [Bacteroidia bacterium]|nr:acetyl-CoA C-acyltransferase [Bacteroidia bacterium]MCZ2248831.1 acetyl-CoA C-acyltransferase [Bacteroidia bacterium]
MNEVYIVSAARTAIGGFGGGLSSVSATKLGAASIKGALEKINLKPEEVQEVYMGCVIQGNLGQAPARQAAKFAGLPDNVICTTVNKVCASGMKAVTLAAQTIMLGQQDVVVAGGMENMSQAPYYLEQARYGYKFGNGTLIDSISKDGLTDVYHNYAMGVAAELCASECKISREEQDAFAVESYKRSAKAWSEGKFDNEIVPVEIPQKKGDPIIVKHDEEYKNVKFEKIPSLNPVFKKDGTVTAANASTINDGASALVLMSKQKMEQLGLKPLAKILSFADAEQAPEWFTTSPSKAIPAALAKIGKTVADVDYFEINEAFSVVSLVNNKEMKIDPAKVNVNGGAVSLGHPLGSSGSRILVTLVNVLHQNNAKIGVAGICNGGGGATAVVIEKC